MKLHTNDTSAGHADEADLVRYIDGESDTAARTALETHIHVCAACSAQLEALRRDAAEIDDALRLINADLAGLQPATLDLPNVRAVVSPWRSPARMAAVFALFALGIAAASPLRARIWSWISGGDEPVIANEQPLHHPTPVASPTTEQYRFVPENSRITIELDAPPSAPLRVALHDAPDVSFEVISAVADVPILVLPNGLVVQNGTGTGESSYRLRIPPAVQTVIVRSQGRSVEIKRTQLSRADFQVQLN